MERTSPAAPSLQRIVARRVAQAGGRVWRAIVMALVGSADWGGAHGRTEG